MNDYSSKLHETMWWMNNRTANSPQVHHSQPWPSHYQEEDEKHEEEEDEQEEEMIEYMFEKALTPSDVGKLNRLVIPKQHAEKYFPLSRLDSAEKGLLLSFEDESGKLWRFRYSYWNSSQSYVLTKGWSRYVKEKQLDAGDVVSFQRRRPDGQQLYIRWKRRVAAAAAAPPPPPVHDSRLSHSSFLAHPTSSTSSSSPGWSRVYYSAHPAYPSQQQHHSPHGPLYHAAVQPAVPAPVTPGRKQVRLFGVNLNCHLDEPEPEPPSPEASSMSSPDPTHFFYSHGHQQDFNYSQEYHNTRNYPGGGGDLSI